MISNLENYPKNGKHLRYFTDLPFNITYGEDNKRLGLWFCSTSDYCQNFVFSKYYKTAKEAFEGAKKEYIKWLEKEIKRVKKEKYEE